MAYIVYRPVNQQSMSVRRYQIKEKIFSIGDSFTIKDEMGQDVYAVRSKLVSLSNKLLLEDMAGK